jgi:hypothetical protein
MKKRDGTRISADKERDLGLKRESDGKSDFGEKAMGCGFRRIK